MKAGKYCYKELFVNRYVSQLVIPEIQRDYVWQKGQLYGFLGSLADSFNQYLSADIPSISAVESREKAESLSRDFAVFYRKRNYSANIGFIYAYSDEQYSGRYFLIDGQQRLTTMYLILLALARRVNKVNDFKKNYCNSGTPKLDYRVRDSSRRFLQHLVPFLLDNTEGQVTDQRWYLKAYDNDVTIKNLLENFAIINQWLDSHTGEVGKAYSEVDFYDYLQNYTEFWYFDTNISAQGENLYIYLNARGEQIQGNENLKADLLGGLSSDEEKNQWGKKWEVWQDYFWRKRNKGKLNQRQSKNPNADQGFNDFLSCIAALKLYLKKDLSFFSKKDCLDLPALSTILELKDVDRYIQVLKYFDTYRGELGSIYKYSDWADKCIDEIWGVLNQGKTAWFIDYRSDRVPVERNRMVFLWSIFYWVEKAIDKQGNIDVVKVFKGVRQFYLRYHNNIRAVNNIALSVENLLIHGFISGGKDKKSEEYCKEHWLADHANHEKDIESTIWEIEDHPYNLDGSDVGAINITHLVDFDDRLTLKKLQSTKKFFYQCFPLGDKKPQHLGVQSALLYFGKFWVQKSPWYYNNYRFDDWKNNIRKSAKNDGYLFRCFLNVLIKKNITVEQFLNDERNKLPPKRDDAKSPRKQLIWYNYYLRENMWSHGNFIAIHYFILDDKIDAVFPKQHAFYNTKGNFRGYNPQRLAEMLPKYIKKKIESGEG